MTKTKRNARFALGISLVFFGVALWSLDNSSLVSVTRWTGNYYFLVPGFILFATGILYIYLMVRSPHATERSFATALFGKKDVRKHK